MAFFRRSRRGDLIYADAQSGEAPKKRRPGALMTAALTVLAALALAAAVLSLNALVQTRQERYDAALALAAEKRYDEAIARLEALGDYRDSASRAADLRDLAAGYEAAAGLTAQQRYDEAVAAYRALGDYADSPTQAAWGVTYRKALDLLEQTDAGRTDLLVRILDSRVRLTDERSYPTVVGYEAAAALFESVGSYADAPAMADRCYESAARVKLSWGDADGARAYLDRLSPDAAARLRQDLDGAE